MAGGLLGLVDQVEGGAAGDDREHDARDDHELAPPIVVLVLHLHRGRASLRAVATRAGATRGLGAASATSSVASPVSGRGTGVDMGAVVPSRTAIGQARPVHAGDTEHGEAAGELNAPFDFESRARLQLASCPISASSPHSSPPATSPRRSSA